MSNIYGQERVEAGIKAVAECAKALGLNLLELRETCRAVAHTCDGIMAERARELQAEDGHTEEEAETE